MTLGIGIVGCGGIGQKRARTLGRSTPLVACADVDPARARALAVDGAKWFSDWRQVVESPGVDAVIVSTPHDSLAEITRRAIEAGKHVLVEKPAARNASELASVQQAAEAGRTKVRVGFNHRYHRAIRKAKAIADSGALGPLLFLRGRYGHGGRPGYDREWRANPARSGGGELLDQGSHLIDLSRWFLGDFPHVTGIARTYFWDMPVEDNAFLLLRTAAEQVASIHVSCTEWKNLFSLELYGRDGKLEVSGLGGSYGVERLTHYKMLAEMGPPETTIWEFPMADDSWSLEMAEFVRDIREDRMSSPGLEDALATLRVIQRVYEGAST